MGRDPLRAWYCQRCGDSGAASASQMGAVERDHLRECPGDYDPNQHFIADLDEEEAQHGE